MKHRFLFALWDGLFILCAGLGFIPEPAGVLQNVMTVLAVACFAPPGLILWQERQVKSSPDRVLVRNLSALSLGLTLVLLVANFLTAVSSETLGTVMHYVLVIVSSPMICSGYWAGSLFCWACLLVASCRNKEKKRG